MTPVNSPHALVNRRTQGGDSWKGSQGFIAALEGRRVSVHEAFAIFIHNIEIPAVAEGENIGGAWDPYGNVWVGGRTYEADHMLTYGLNLFSPVARVDASNQQEPAIVALSPDGSVVAGGRPSSRFSEAIFRVTVAGVTLPAAQACAWRLWSVFRRSPSFHWTALINCFGSVPAESFSELVVHSVVPVDEPADTERDSVRVHVSFRVRAEYSRSVRPHQGG